MTNNRETRLRMVKVIRNDKGQYAVSDFNDNIIVPFGKYAWIDEFEQGLARVRTDGRSMNTKDLVIYKGDWEVYDDPKSLRKILLEEFRENPDSFQKWGIIDEKGNEVLPLEYQEIWNFVNKGRYSTNVMKDGVCFEVFFHDLNPNAPEAPWLRHNDYDREDIHNDYFDIDRCYDYDGNFDYDRLEDAIMDGEYVLGD